VQTTLAAYAVSSGLSTAWGRIFFVFGPHEPPAKLVASVITSLLRGEAARCSHGRQIRDFLYVRDAADAFVALLDSDVQGPVNVASGQPLALREVVTRIGLRLQRPELVRLGALPPQPDEPPLLIADVRRLTEELAWQPKYDLDAALEETIGWWREQG
jgi:nucleoside-diphosphate-sugar epimerase